MKRGEVRYYTFKAPDKKRPVAILSRDSIISHLNEITIAPITSTIRDIPSEVLLTKADGMPKDCVINLDHIQTVPKAKIGKIITTLSADRIKHLDKAITFALDIQF
jgi:mRNA interferase MazF